MRGFWTLASLHPPVPMPKNTLDREIRACVDAFVEDLTTLVKQAAMESVQEALGGTVAPRRRGPGRPRKTAKKRGTRKKRIRRTSGDVDAIAAKVLSHVKANPGSGVTEIAASLRTTSKDLRLPILKLLEEKKLRTTGQRRGTKYHAGGRRGPVTRKRKAAKKKARKKKRVAKKTTKRKASKKGRRQKTAKRRGKKKTPRKAAKHKATKRKAATKPEGAKKGAVPEAIEPEMARKAG